MPSHPARFRLWLAVLAGTLAAVLLVEALRPKALTPVQAQATAALPAPVRADLQAAAPAVSEVATSQTPATAVASIPTTTRIAPSVSKTHSRHARRHRKSAVVVATAQHALPSASSKDTATAPRLDSLAATHTDSCLDGIAFVAVDSLTAKATSLPTDSLTASASAEVLLPKAPELAATAPRPCLQLPKEPETLKPEAPQAVLLPGVPEKSLQLQ